MGSIPTRSRHLSGALAGALTVGALIALHLAPLPLPAAWAQEPMPGAARAMKPDSTDLGRAKGLRRPFWVMMRSVAFPGWGQAYNGKWIKAIVIGGTEAAFIYGAVNEDRLARDAARLGGERPGESYYWGQVMEDHKSRKRDYIWWGAFTLLVSMGDAFVDAHLKGFDAEFRQADSAVLVSYRVPF